MRDAVRSCVPSVRVAGSMSPALVQAFLMAHDKHAQVPVGEAAVAVWAIGTGAAAKAPACWHESSNTASRECAVVTPGGHSHSQWSLEPTL